MTIPEYITSAWLDSVGDEKLLSAETALHNHFRSLELEQKTLLGQKYDMMRGPAELLAAWDRWSRVNTEARTRRLKTRRS